MLVAEILKSKGDAVFTIGPDETVAGAAAQLVERQVGALIVCENDRVAGVLSERDVVRALARDGAAALEQPVRDHMTADVIFAEPGEGVDVLMGRMTDRRIRHLPVRGDLHRRRGEVPDRRRDARGREPEELYSGGIGLRD